MDIYRYYTAMSTCKAILYDADVAALAKIFDDMLFFNATDLASSECHSWKIKESMLSGTYIYLSSKWYIVHTCIENGYI